jgi:hypothetical protein
LNPKGTAAYLAGADGPDSLPGGRRALSVVQGDSVPQNFIPKLIALDRKGLFPFDCLETYHEFWQITRAIADARCGRAVKPVLRVSEGQGESRKSALRFCLVCGDGYPEGAAFAGFALDLDMTCHFVDQALDDIESQARPLSIFF